jgi:dGTPase
MYSDALRRLGGVTQIVPSDERSLFHTRLTHTLKVAQISRRLAQHLLRAEGNEGAITQLGGLDPDVAEAAGFAHDLGHPPFGHVGESALNEKCEQWGLDGFEGNAQTFRILTKLLRGKVPSRPGLDLPPNVLNAVIKYPWLREGSKAGN